MGVEESLAFCRSCNQQALFRSRSVNHALHLLLSLLSLGLWLPVWLILSIRSSRRVCVLCGSATGLFSFGVAEIAAAAVVMALLSLGILWGRAWRLQSDETPRGLSPSRDVATVAETSVASGQSSQAAVLAKGSSDELAQTQKALSIQIQRTHEAPPATDAGRRLPQAERRCVVTLRHDKISIQSAAQQICEQAGLNYEWRKSYDATQPLCRRYISVNVADSSVERALDEIVLKNGLKYRIVGRSVWLER